MIAIFLTVLFSDAICYFYPIVIPENYNHQKYDSF